VRQALRSCGGFDIVAEAGGGTTAVAAAHEHQPDMVVLDRNSLIWPAASS
jgi:DNA-binding NarL/FixJ family response regulator